jgi:hypothetical protein
VSKFDRDRWNRFAATVVFILPVGILEMAAQPRPSPSPQAQKRMVRAVDRTLREGMRAQLPPHLSTLLGVSEEKECLVMQSLVRSEKVVQGFDVSMASKNDAVLFVVNETTKDQILYLTSGEGALRKVVSVKGGIGRVLRISSEDEKAFDKEKQFWLDRLAPVGGSK